MVRSTTFYSKVEKVSFDLVMLGNFMLRSKVINSSAHHAVHHLYFNYNYGQYFTLWDRIGGSHRQPSEEQYNDILRNDKDVWNKQAEFVNSLEGKSTIRKQKTK